MSTIYDGNPNGMSTGETSLPWLCFTGAEGGGSVAMKLNGSQHPGIDLDVSFDRGQTWTPWNLSAINLAEGEKVWIRGDNTRISGGTVTTASHFASIFVMTGRIKASGSVMSLIYRNDPLSDTLPINSNSHGFEMLFMDCDSLLTPPELPAVKSSSGGVPSYCYNMTFAGCSRLKYAPLLPIRNSSSYCYYMMFYGCTSLVEAPEINFEGTAQANSCYWMFYGCTSLKKPPSILKATTLGGNAYYGMFRDCVNLQYAPQIMAETIAGYSFALMFYGCTSLKKAPSFKSMTASGYEGCFSYCFYKCSALEEVPAEIVVSRPGTRMFQYCFYGCTSLKKGPDFTFLTGSSTGSETYCFFYAFSFCSSLTEAPKVTLPRRIAAWIILQLLLLLLHFTEEDNDFSSMDYIWKLWNPILKYVLELLLSRRVHEHTSCDDIGFILLQLNVQWMLKLEEAAKASSYRISSELLRLNVQ